MVSESPARAQRMVSAQAIDETNSPMTIPITSRVVKDFIGPFFFDYTPTTAPYLESCITTNSSRPLAHSNSKTVIGASGGSLRTWVLT